MSGGSPSAEEDSPLSFFDKPVTQKQGLALLMAVLAIFTLIFLPVYLQIRGMRKDVEQVDANTAEQKHRLQAINAKLAAAALVGRVEALQRMYIVYEGSHGFELITFGSISDQEISSEKLDYQCTMRAGSSLIVREVDAQGYVKSEYDFSGARMDGECPDGSMILSDVVAITGGKIMGWTPDRRVEAMREALTRFRNGTGGGT